MLPLEVLHYIGYANDRGGIVSIVRALAQADRFVCVLGVNPEFRQLRTPPLETLELPKLNGERLGIWTLFRSRLVARAAYRWLDAKPTRVFHGHSRAGMVVALWLSSMGAKRVVASVHCYGRQRWFYRWVARRLGERLFWLSPSMKRYYGYGAADWEQCIPGCIAPGPAPRPTEKAASYAIRFGGIGAIVPWKRWDLVLEAMAAVPAQAHGRIHFAHIGAVDGSPGSSRCRAALLGRTRELGLGASVEWMGEQPSSGEFLRTIDCLVVSSECEPFSISVLEALAAGVPVLAADSGGARDVIEPSSNGWLFRSGDAQDLGRMLAMLAQGDALRGAHPSLDALGRFTADNVAEQWAGVYRGLSGAQ